MSFTVTNSDLQDAASEKRVAQIKKAFEVFGHLIRTQFEPLAQILTRKPRLKVEPHHSSSFTDGKRIALRVPLELGGDTEHTKHLCEVRDEDGAMYCPACYVLDDAIATVAHEVAHIVHDSFTEVDRKTIQKIFDGTLRPRIEAVDPSKVASAEAAVLTSKNAMEIASRCDAWLPMVTNALEDVFVNESMYASRPGFRDPIRGTTIRHLMKGHVKIDGTRAEWKDSPKDARAIMVAYAIAADIEKVLPSLGNDLDDVINDQALRDTVTKIHSKVTAQDRLELALETLDILRGHGLCVDDRSLIFQPVKIPGMPPPPPSDDDTEKDDGQDGEPGEEAGDSPDADEDDDDAKASGKPSPSKKNDDDEGDEPKNDDDDQAGTSGDDDESEGSEDDGDDDQGASADDDDDSDEEDDAPASDGSGDDDDLEEDDGDDDQDGKDNGSDADDDDDLDSDDDNPFDDDDDDYDHDGSESDHNQDMPDERDQDDEDSDQSGADAAKGAAADVELQREEAEKALKAFMGHGDEDEDIEPTFEDEVDRELTKLLLEQKDMFDDPSFNVREVGLTNYTGIDPNKMGHERNKAPKDGDISPVLNQLRIAFSNNRKVGMQRSLKAGPKLDGAHLYRTVLDDPRVFARRNVPKKQSWAVTIGMDMSGSTGYDVSSVIKNAGYAMAELLRRLGIPFSMYGHSGSYIRQGGSYTFGLDMFHVKNFDEQWNEDAKDRCLALAGADANLDGHSLEFYRRSIEGRRETSKLIIYYTDGQMPAANYDEELTLLQKNIVVCQRKGIHLLGVGVGTDSPKAHGLDTVRYDSIRDLPNLITELGKRLV